MPPIAKLKIKLSMSKPVLAARLNKEGGLQYSGTNRGSVKPKGIVNALTTSISFLAFLLRAKIISQIKNKIKENTSHSLSIAMLTQSLIELYILAKSHPVIRAIIITSAV